MDKIILNSSYCNCCPSDENILKITSGNDFSIEIQLTIKEGDEWVSYDLSDVDVDSLVVNVVSPTGERYEIDAAISSNKVVGVVDANVLEQYVVYGIEVIWRDDPYDKRAYGPRVFELVDSSLEATEDPFDYDSDSPYEYNLHINSDIAMLSIGQIPTEDFVTLEMLDEMSYVTQGELTVQINQLWQDCNDQFVDNDELAYVIDNLPLPDMSSYVSKDELNQMSYVDHAYLDSNYPSKTYLDSYYPSYTYLYSYVGDAISNIDVDIDLSSYGKTLSRAIDRWYGADYTQAVVLNGPNGEISRVILQDNAAWKDNNGEWKTRVLYAGLLRHQDLIEFKQNTERITTIENSLPSYITQDELSANAYITQNDIDRMSYVSQSSLDAMSYVDYDSLNNMSYVDHAYLDSNYPSKTYLDSNYPSYTYLYSYVGDVIDNIPSPDLSSYVTYTYLGENYVSYNELNNYTEAISTVLTYQRVDINNTYGYLRNYYTKTESDSRYVTPSQIAANYVDYDSLNDLSYGTSAALNDLNDRITYIEEQGSGGSVDLSSYVTYIDWDNTNEAISQELTDNRLAHLDINNQFSYYYTKTDSDSRYATQSWANSKFVNPSDDVNRQQAIAAAFASTVQSTYVHNIWQGTQSDYNNISTPDPNTLYVII